MNAFKYVPEVDEFVCGNCFREFSTPETPDAAEDSVDFEDDLNDVPQETETISQRANRIWRQRQIDKLESEQAMLEGFLAVIQDEIGYARITMDEENTLVGDTVRGFRIVDRLEEIEKELVLLRSKQ